MRTDPSAFVRQYHLATVDGGMAWDQTYLLVFTKDGRMFVRVVKEFEQPYKTPDIHEVYPEEFSKIIIDGAPLSELVALKFEEILASQH